MSTVIKLSAPATHEFWEIPVLFEDDHLLALDKPLGLLSAPEANHPDGVNLLQLLHEGIAAGKPWARERNLSYLNSPCPLEADTTGAFLLAKSKAAHIALADLLGSERPVRRYVALVLGSLAQKQFEVDAKIGPHPVTPGLVRIDRKEGKKSRTSFEVLERFSNWTLLACTPLTKRSHQIRVHLKHAGFPIVGDEAYGGKKLWLSRIKPGYRLKPGHEERPLISRPALHAEGFQLPHPVTGETISITSPVPKDMKVALKYLRQFAADSGTMVSPPGPTSDLQ